MTKKCVINTSSFPSSCLEAKYQDRENDYIKYAVMLHIDNPSKELEYGTLLLALQVMGTFFMEWKVNKVTFNIFEKGTTHVLGAGNVDLPIDTLRNTTSSDWSQESMRALPAEAQSIS